VYWIELPSYASLQVVGVSFDDDPDAFRNINIVEELNKS
jgi:molybdopterin-guanine dinucleotide biosynthesis protein A